MLGVSSDFDFDLNQIGSLIHIILSWFELTYVKK